VTPLLEVQSVSKSFGGLHALSEVSFDVAAGEIFAVIGPNGAGKTTLFNCLAGAVSPTTGAIRLGGERIDGRPPHEICRRGLARTFQLVKPFRGMTVLENVKVAAFSRHPSSKQATIAAQAVLDRVGMADLAEVDAETLNVAQLRQLEIARALATQPRLLLLDEMLAGLTATESVAMCERIQQLPREGIAVLVVEHSIPVVTSLCSRAVVLCFGKVLTGGAPRDVIADPRVQEAYLGNAQP
jgi:branched-chain amino acid transport system ATP-binding protein